jgi:hypothetical protein
MASCNATVRRWVLPIVTYLPYAHAAPTPCVNTVTTSAAERLARAPPYGGKVAVLGVPLVICNI